MVSSLYGGSRTITLPAAKKVTEVFSNSLISGSTSTFTVNMEDHQTMLFRLE